MNYSFANQIDLICTYFSLKDPEDLIHKLNSLRQLIRISFCKQFLCLRRTCDYFGVFWTKRMMLLIPYTRYLITCQRSSRTQALFRISCTTENLHLIILSVRAAPRISFPILNELWRVTVIFSHSFSIPRERNLDCSP